MQLIDGIYGRKKRELFQTSDFFVLPTHFKNFELAIADALASGTPVIATVDTPCSELNTESCRA